MLLEFPIPPRNWDPCWQMTLMVPRTHAPFLIIVHMAILWRYIYISIYYTRTWLIEHKYTVYVLYRDMEKRKSLT